MLTQRLAKAFSFNTTKQLVSGTDSILQINQLIRELDVPAKSPVLVVTDPGIISTGIELPLLNILKDDGFDPVVYMDTQADPSEKHVLDAVQVAEDTGAKAVVGFGGGSSMDVAKLVAFLSHESCTQTLSDIYGVGMCRGARLPLIQVPTTAGTGSEVTPISIITTGENEKKGVVSPVLLPDVALLDGALTTSLPSHVTAATGIDAMVHAIEAYTSKEKKNPLSDALAIEALKLLGPNIRTAVDDGTHMEARSAMLLGSTYAGMAFANSPVGAVHALAYPIGAKFHVPHGLSNSLVLPHVLEFNMGEESAKALYDDIAPLVFPELVGSSNPHAQLPSAFKALAESFNLPTELKQVGIQAEDIQGLVDDAMKQTRLLPNNIREVFKSDAREIYDKAF